MTTTVAAATAMETAATAETATAAMEAATTHASTAGGSRRLGRSYRRRLRALRADHRIVVVDLVRRSPHEPRRVESPAE